MELIVHRGACRYDPALAVPLARALAAEPDLFDRLTGLRDDALAARGSLQRRLRLTPALHARAELLAAAPGGVVPGGAPGDDDLPPLAAALAHLGRYRPFFAAVRARCGVPRRRLDPRTAALLAEVMAEHAPLVQPAAVVALGDARVEQAGVTVGGLSIASADLARALRPGAAADGRTRVALFAATIGPALDERVAALAPAEPTRALLLNAFGAAAAELGGEDVSARVAAALPGPGRLRRFHLGYGDWTLAGQGDLLALLGAERALEIRVTAAGVMVPEKSVSGLVSRRG
ncbi:MAG TPA: hypothetical protein VGQ83_14030 [Polyangia bacterium]